MMGSPFMQQLMQHMGQKSPQPGQPGLLGQMIDAQPQVGRQVGGGGPGMLSQEIGAQAPVGAPHGQQMPPEAMGAMQALAGGAGQQQQPQQPPAPPPQLQRGQAMPGQRDLYSEYMQRQQAPRGVLGGIV